ncbi:DUF3293 domain-containing protein [Sulfitobacter sp. JBTF-M27]|uniref:DUF3293 domain-containing protein n=1 Tax=Sulfitobacter sediminilitoris TaxID=2698830 RepID=A0A6P0CFI2_9RHOB|nr:DUF3293 domain-containing protein [Sulfitobacter sediminilitoris]NEK24919.1 DUF3293 domain-containing protein [Sulfitobacter sediminilitoris]
MDPSDVSSEKVAAYEATHYQVGSGTDAFVMRVGKFSANLNALFERNEKDCAIFITAFNPLGETQGIEANEEAQSRLYEQLCAITEVVIEGVGADPTGAWPPEASYLALGVDQKMAEHLGRSFRQDVVLWAGADAVPRLLFLR